MFFLFTTERESLNQAIIIICSVYSLICFSFLLFQLYAFYKAHVEYDEKVENIKFKVFEAEGISLNEIEDEVY